MTIPRNGGRATSRGAVEQPSSSRRAAVEQPSSRGDDCFDGDNEEVRADIFMSIVAAWVIVNAWDS